MYHYKPFILFFLVCQPINIPPMRSLIDSSLGRFRLIGFVEGASLLFLLIIALPLKYFTAYPYILKQAGLIHGIFFIQYLYQAYVVKEDKNWSFKTLSLAWFVALLPFGTFIFDNWLKKQPH